MEQLFMNKEDLNNITITKDNVTKLAEIALDLKLPDDDPLRQNIQQWFSQKDTHTFFSEERLENIQNMLNNGFYLTQVAKANHTTIPTIKRLIKEGKIKLKSA